MLAVIGLNNQRTKIIFQFKYYVLFFDNTEKFSNEHTLNTSSYAGHQMAGFIIYHQEMYLIMFGDSLSSINSGLAIR